MGYQAKMAASIVQVCCRHVPTTSLSLHLFRLLRRTVLRKTQHYYSSNTSRPFRPLGDYTGVTRRLVLGIETSCDDTGAAVVDNWGRVLGEGLHSQTSTHVELGGILPPIAQQLHEVNIENVVTTAIKESGVTYQDIDAIAVTVKPGLSLSLRVGLQHAKQLVLEHRKPMIPIHHMEAHALTGRMIEQVEYPFLVLLASGGHCLLAVAKDVEDFVLLGTSLDNAPGDAFDKVARSLKLKNLKECYGLSGGASVELVAQNGDPNAFSFPQVMVKSADCNFSFAGIISLMHSYIADCEKKQNIQGDGVISNVGDLCASFQCGVLKHLAKRLQRALVFTEMTGLLGQEKTLILSGGVASNQFLVKHLRKLCDQYNCRLVCPPPKLCTDNGIMIAWNGMEKLVRGLGVAEDPEKVDIQAKCPLGGNLTEKIINTKMKLARLKLL